jgi:chromosome segregation ATPase
MNTPTLARQICLGLLIGVLITPTQTAQAQWTVFDPSQYALQVKKRLEEAERYVKMFDNAVKQFTTLKGVLEKAEDLVAKQRNAITTMSNIGRTVRGVYQLKDQLEAIVISRMGALRSINERLRKGIFDPEADMRDFEEYLRNSIGRSSQDTVANLQRLMKMDNQLKRMNDDLEKARVGLAGAELSKQEAENKHEEELAKPESERCASCIANLDEQMANYDLLIAHYYSEIARLEYQVEERKKKYNIQMDERVKFGEQVQSMNKSWSRFNDSLDELHRTLSKY